MTEVSFSLLFLLTRLVSIFVSKYGGADAVEIPVGLLTVDETSPIAFDTVESSSLTRKRLLDGSSMEDSLT